MLMLDVNNVLPTPYQKVIEKMKILPSIENFSVENTIEKEQ